MIETELLGCQTPSKHIYPPFMDTSLAEEGINFLSLIGMQLLPWQELVLKNWLALDGGRWSCNEWGLSVPRQNGKNYLFEARELIGLLLVGEQIIHTAHHSNTIQSSFERLVSWFENPNMPYIKSKVSKIIRSPGRQEIHLTNKGSIRFLTRTKASGRGLTCDLLIFDEAQEIVDGSISALTPTNSAGGLKNSQTIYAGTPPNELANGVFFTNMRNNALDDAKGFTTGWLEWSASEDDDPDTLDTWAKGNPSLGLNMQPSSLEQSFNQMPMPEFYRERLGAWINYTDDAVITMQDWNACVNYELGDLRDGEIALGVDISPNRNNASIVALFRCHDGKVGVQVVKARSGPVDWIVPFLEKVVRDNTTEFMTHSGNIQDCQIKGIFLDGGGNAATLVQPLSEKKIIVNTLNTSQVIQGCAVLYDHCVTKALWQGNDIELNVAVVNGRRRMVQDGWLWSRSKAIADITPLVAASYGLYGLLTNDFKPALKRAGRSMFI